MRWYKPPKTTMSKTPLLNFWNIQRIIRIIICIHSSSRPLHFLDATAVVLMNQELGHGLVLGAELCALTALVGSSCSCCFPLNSSCKGFVACVTQHTAKGTEALLFVQGPSPDEVALVEAGKQLGFEFCERTMSNITLNLQGNLVKFDILNVLEFTSERKRMSVIARANDGTIRLYCKGADNAVLERLQPNTDAELLRVTRDNLYNFSVQVSVNRPLQHQQTQPNLLLHYLSPCSPSPAHLLWLSSLSPRAFRDSCK